MRRLAVILVVLAAGAGVIASGSEDEGGKTRYWIELDTAFGLVEGGDMRIAGVNAGSVTGIELDQRTLKARVEVEVEATGFDSLRKDAFCETRPQSPLGEYFVDCRPGNSSKRLPAGATLPVDRTAATVPNDLVLDVWRRPYRERLRLILGEFGAGLAGRGDDLNDAIRRAVPALRQTDRLLAVLAEHDRVIERLIGDADTVLAELARGRRGIGRFVAEARDTASASAERADDLATNWRELPAFLEELEGTMASLGELTEEQTPVLSDLRASARRLRRVLDAAGDVSDGARAGLPELAKAGRVGRQAANASRPVVSELRRFTRPLRELSTNQRILLEDFSDPERAVEPDPRSPGGRGFSGSEALLMFLYYQSIQLNSFDINGYQSRVISHVEDACGDYADAEAAKHERTFGCRSWLGPNQPGVTTPDPSPSAAAERAARAKRRARERRESGERPTAPELPRALAPLPPESPLPSLPAGSDAQRSIEALFDYLLAP